jgi:hypothetical protein
MKVLLWRKFGITKSGKGEEGEDAPRGISGISLQDSISVLGVVFPGLRFQILSKFLSKLLTFS